MTGTTVPAGAAGTTVRPLPARPRQLGALGCLHPNPAASTRLVCFPHAGGSPGAFRAWAAALTPEVEVWTVALPGHGPRQGEPFARDWSALRDDLTAAVEAMDAVEADDAGPEGRPFALLGHSFGALVAYEVARELERRGTRLLQHVFVAGSRAPHRLADPFPLPDDDERLVVEVDARFGAVPPAVRKEPDLLARFIPILRADLELAGSYGWTGGTALRCPITALAGTDDRAGPPGEAGHWRSHTQGAFDVVTLPGGHFFLHGELPAVARTIRPALLAAGSRDAMDQVE